MRYDVAREIRDLHVTLDLSHYEDVFLVADIHDEYEELQLALDAAGFDPTRHALVTAGDLVDRGPNPLEFLNWLKKDWFYRTLGNHDVFPGMYLDRQISSEFMERVGAQWFLALPMDRQAEIARILQKAPVSMTVLTPGGRRIGIAHADCVSDWRTQENDLRLGGRGRMWLTDLTTQSRNTVNRLFAAAEAKERVDPEEYRVANIDHVFHGHTIIANHVTVANRTWFDTGMCVGGKFTIISVDKFLSTLP